MVLAEDFGGGEGLREHVEDNLVVHRRTCRDGGLLTYGTMLRRDGGCGDEPACGLFDVAVSGIGLQIVEQEVGSTLHDGVIVCQELFVTRVEIMLPEVGGEPGAARGEHAPGGAVHGSGDAPEVGIVVGHPTLAAIHLLSRLRTRLTQVADHREEGLLCLCEIAYQRRPVVHLGIDVDGVFRVPWGIHLVVPHTLEVCGLATRLTRRNQQVSAILHHQRHHIEVCAVEGSQALIRGQGTSSTSLTGLTS